MRASLLVSATLFLAACAPRLSPGAPCDLTSDCDAPLVCRNERCRVACIEARDCDFGLRCVQSSEGPSCTLPPEETCEPSRPCPGALRCVFGECRSECIDDGDCTRDGQCIEGSCVETPSGTDAGPIVAPDAGSACVVAAMVCGNGVIDGCDGNLAMLAPVLAGSPTGELERLEGHFLPARPWPTRGGVDSPLVPEISLGLSGAGFGVVTQITGGEERRLELHRFPLDELGAAALLPFPSLADTCSATAGEDGDTVRLFALLSVPDVDGQSGWEITVEGAGEPALGNIRPGSPPNVSRARMTYAGGLRSISDGAPFSPLFYVARETLFEGPPVVGAIDDARSLYDYRTSLTGAVPRLPDDHVAMSGTAGSVVLLYASGSTVGVWDIFDTPILGDPPRERTEDVVALSPSGGIAGIPAAERVADREYVLAVPTSADGVGYTNFYAMVCPELGSCALAEPRGQLQTRTGRPPSLVRLATVLGGLGLASLEPEAEPAPGPSLFLRFLAPSLVELSPNEALDPLLRSEGDWETVDVELRAVTQGGLTTIVAAALQRNARLREDRVWLGGYRACTVR